MDIICPSPERHLNTIELLFARTFSDYWEWVDVGPDGYFEGAPYDWTASRIGVVGKEVVTHFGVWDFTMRIGSATVRVACIGAVATDRELRKGGLMRETAAASVNSLRDTGYDLSLLFGIANFYGRYGYVSTFARHTTSVEVRELDSADPPVALTPFTGAVTELAPLYNRENEGVTGTFVRPTYTRLRRPKVFSPWIFEGGYIVGGLQDEVYKVVDCAGPPERVLDAARQLAVKAVAPQITFMFVPDRSVMGEYLRTITHKRHSWFVPAGGPMIKVVNLHSTMEKLAPVLGERLAASTAASYTGRLTIVGDGEELALAVNTGRVAVGAAAPEPDGVITAGTALGRLLIGDDDPLRICRQSGIELAGDARALVPVLFPDQEPSTILWDLF